MRCFLLTISVAAAVAIGFPGGAAAGWRVVASGGAAAKAKTLGSGNRPTGAVAGHKVSVTWLASAYLEGGAPAGYVVRRYNAATGAEQVVGSTCSGTISALTCTESGVPAGSWQYTITPATANWRGSQSVKSTTVVV
jgi:hypothetical protein